ncbi:MAG: arginine deiminase family protein, partial [Rectinema sp.]|nr:arginine deiminase family protein [Rectinema sp.]
MKQVHIDSEIGRLRRVIVHSPGAEVEAMTPREAERDLYNDIIPLEAVQNEYRMLHQFLSRIAATYELIDLLSDCLENEGDRCEFLDEYAKFYPISIFANTFMAMPAPELARALLTGIQAPAGSLSCLLEPHAFIARPLPNAYFMRDSLAVVGTRIISSAFAFDVRMAEACITRFIFRRHPDFRNAGLIFDGPEERNRLMTIEGGDTHVLAPDVLAIGISERTTAFAVDRVARNLAMQEGKSVTIFAVDLPKERATIHLDMAFTMIDRNAALAFKPIITGPSRVPVYRLDCSPDGTITYTQEDSLFSGLRKVGIDLEPIYCGDGRAVIQEREQWLSGANSFAFAPGKILMYSCNKYTLDALA